MRKNQIDAIKRMPLIAILRGITPDEAENVSDALADTGFYFIEVTLDSPQWETSMQKIKDKHGDGILLGAGTVLSPQDVERVHAAGGRAIISPNTNASVIRRSKKLNMLAVAGCFTPTECFTALNAGADILKIFPANTVGIHHLKSIKTVLPDAARLCPTGGINADNLKAYLAAGAFAVGIGNALYQPRISLQKLTESARRLAALGNAD